jgi:hypothetical protein
MPGDTKTHLARLAKRSRRSKGDLDAARKRLFSALEHAEAVMRDAAAEGDAALVLKAVHATTQTTAAFARVVEVGELEARLAELEAAIETRKR